MKSLMIALLALAASPAFAETSVLPQANEKLESVGQLTLRSTSPDSDFGTKGEKIGWVKQGETVKVLEVKQVSTVFGFEVWVQVETESHVKGWIFDGMSSEVAQGHANLEAKALPEVVAQAN